MTVYVDKSRNHFGRMVMCHMLADTLEELHAMADKLGLRRWFQPSPPASLPHYDIALSKRGQALKLGAVECDRLKVRELMRRARAERAGAEMKEEALP